MSDEHLFPLSRCYRITTTMGDPQAIWEALKPLLPERKSCPDTCRCLCHEIE